MLFRDELRKLGACPPAIVWVGKRTREEAWRDCERADWMMWYLAHRIHWGRVVLLTCQCVRRVLRHVPPRENRPLLAIEAAERCAREPSTDNLTAAQIAEAAARAAVITASWVAEAAARAALLAVLAAKVADAAGDALAATDAVRAVAHAAWAAEAAGDALDAEAAEHRAMCDMIRKEVALEELIKKGENDNGES